MKCLRTALALSWLLLGELAVTSLVGDACIGTELGCIQGLSSTCHHQHFSAKTQSPTSLILRLRGGASDSVEVISDGTDNADAEMGDAERVSPEAQEGPSVARIGEDGDDMEGVVLNPQRRAEAAAAWQRFQVRQLPIHVLCDDQY
eukprot:2529198-Rhodomonas_salina.1